MAKLETIKVDGAKNSLVAWSKKAGKGPLQQQLA